MVKIDKKSNATSIWGDGGNSISPYDGYTLSLFVSTFLITRVGNMKKRK
jgi:hypothetical protein